MEFLKIPAISLVVINTIAYVVMAADKYQAKSRGRRVPELMLFFLAFAFGAIGVFLGMKAPLYHKAAKPAFRYGIPFLILVNALLIFFLIG